MRVTLRCVKETKDLLIFECCCPREKKSKKGDNNNEDLDEENDEYDEEMEGEGEDIENSNEEGEEGEDEEEEEGESGEMDDFIVEDDEEVNPNEPVLPTEVFSDLKSKKMKLEDPPFCPGPGIEYTFLKEENPKFMTAMTCPLFEWVCDIHILRAKPDHYQLDCIDNLKSWGKRESYSYSSLCYVAKKFSCHKKHMETFKGHLKKQGIKLTNTISVNDSDVISKFYRPLLRLASVNPNEITGYISSCKHIFVNYDTYVKEKELLENLEENLCVSEEQLMLYWFILRGSVPEKSFSEANPELFEVWKIYSDLTEEHFAKEKVKDEEKTWNKTLISIIQGDTETFHLKEVNGIKEVMLASRSKVIDAFVNIVKNRNLNISVQRVEDDYYEPYMEELENMHFEKAKFFIYTKKKDRAFYLHSARGISKGCLISSETNIPKDCLTLCIDKANLYELEDLIEILKPLEKHQELKLYGSLFSPYYQKKSINVINTFGYLQITRIQLPNVYYSSLCPYIHMDDRNIKFIEDIQELKKKIKGYPKAKRFTIFHSNAKIRDGDRTLRDLKNVTETTFFNWFEKKKYLQHGFWKAILNLKMLDIKQFSLLFNECKTEFLIFGTLEVLNTNNKLLLEKSPHYDSLVSYLK